MHSHNYYGVQNALQAFNADLVLAENILPCNAILASKLNVSIVNYWAVAPVEPDLTALWPQSFRRWGGCLLSIWCTLSACTA